MGYESRIKSFSLFQKLAHFITFFLLIYISGSFILWSMSLILEKRDIFYRDYSSGACYAVKDSGQDLADFYNIYNMPRWTYMELLERYTFTTIFLSAALIFIVAWMSSASSKEPEPFIGSGTGIPAIQDKEEPVPGLAQVKKDFTDFILLDLDGHTKEEILLGLSRFARASGLVNEEEALYQSFMEKERRGSTAIGNGIAMPEVLYARLSRPNAVIFCRTREGVDFGSFDGRPVKFLLASLNRDKSDSVALKPAISRMLHFLRNEEYRSRIIRARTESDVYRLFKEALPY